MDEGHQSNIDLPSGQFQNNSADRVKSVNSIGQMVDQHFIHYSDIVSCHCEGPIAPAPDKIGCGSETYAIIYMKCIFMMILFKD